MTSVNTTKTQPISINNLVIFIGKSLSISETFLKLISNQNIMEIKKFLLNNSDVLNFDYQGDISFL